MHLVDELPFEIRSEEHFWVPMSDGVRLAGRLWRPRSADRLPVPAVLEYIPYRRRDLTAVRDSMHHPYIAGHGYACVRVDLRGTGDSEGVLTDEYLEREQQDAEEVLAWLAEQPWCDGNTAMMGLSWGGFSALQVAARRPASLRTIAITSFTDDRYADDFHYMGGCLLSDNLAEAGTTFAYSTCPPDPETVGADWRSMWLDRLEANRPWIIEWLRHQRRDDYWRHASVSEDYARVRCPVLASSGWADGYSNAVLRLMEHLDSPVKGLVGPWSHRYPHMGDPGPAIGYLQEVVRWLDRWTKGEDNGVEKETGLWVWMQESVPPSTSYRKRPGRWVHEPRWPSDRVEDLSLPLSENRLLSPGEKGTTAAKSIRSPLSVGQFAGKWASYSAPPDLPYDQREEDGGSLVFDTDPLRERMEILGTTRVVLELSVAEPVAMVAARLCDVAPDGSATRVTYGLLNLTHRDGHEAPRTLVPGEPYRVEVTMNGVAQAFPPGHRVRLSLSTSYWPLAWPPPRPALMSVHPGASALVLPVRPAPEEEHSEWEGFDEPEAAPAIETTRRRTGEHSWSVHRNLADNRFSLEIVKDGGILHLDDIDLDVTRKAHEVYDAVGGDFTSVRGRSAWTMCFSRGEWHTRTETHTTLECSEDEFRVHATLDAYESGERIFSRQWTETVPRDHV
ncbi:peptidase S15 [Nocardiopsis terrae]|uniref:CocE/NonD family hydrolase n=1 Tax=Nocardiopsis terrae TaxID=372655 RepID=A0ABR9HG95_9ACTN|nr:CocE/NonD family hydrolase [Nocardiopsis terrae]MBE1458052.1 putative CocE/NonD family hydrolase [Nocardiopsis terrae]GHC82461.1 peptidase S15 [Nocardiopsis terrae]